MNQSSKKTPISSTAKPPSVKGSDQEMLLDGFFRNHPGLRDADVVLPMTNDAKEFIGECWPMSNSYFNPLGALHLIQVTDLSWLSRRSIWMVRDGLIPLLWFFRRFPEPVGLTSQILIAEEFMSCVPKAWAARIGTYRLHSETQPTDKTRLALIGLASEAYCELSFLKSILDEVSSDEPNIKRQIDLYIPTRSNWQDNAAQSYHAEYFRLIFATLGTNCRVVSQSEITAAHDAQDLRLYDLNDKMMLADNMIAHEALSRGAQWALTRPIAPDEEFVRLSPHHGFVIRRSPRIEVVKNDLEDSFRQNFRYQQRLESALTSRVFRQLPWPRWFMEWVRVNVEELVPTATRIHSGSAQSADARTSAGPRSPNSRGRQASSVVDKKPSRK